MSDKLFTRAIMQSGSTLTPMSLMSAKGSNTQKMVNLMKASECPVDTSGEDAKFTSESFSCVRQKAQDGEIQMTMMEMMMKDHNMPPVMPTVDGTFLTLNPFDLVKGITLM